MAWLFYEIVPEVDTNHALGPAVVVEAVEGKSCLADHLLVSSPLLGRQSPQCRDDLHTKVLSAELRRQLVVDVGVAGQQAPHLSCVGGQVSVKQTGTAGIFSYNNSLHCCSAYSSYNFSHGKFGK